MTDLVKWNGKLKIRRIPDVWTPEDYDYWWLPREVYPVGHKLAGQVKVGARLSEEEKDNLTVCESENTLLVAGVTSVLDYVIATGTPSVSPFISYMAFGEGSISSINTLATSLATEFARKAITSIVNYGAQATMTAVTAAGDAVGNWTCIGWFGGASASSTLGSGQLQSEVLIFPAFVKGATSYSNDYQVGLISN